MTTVSKGNYILIAFFKKIINQYSGQSTLAITGEFIGIKSNRNMLDNHHCFALDYINLYLNINILDIGFYSISKKIMKVL